MGKQYGGTERRFLKTSGKLIRRDLIIPLPPGHVSQRQPYTGPYRNMERTFVMILIVAARSWNNPSVQHGGRNEQNGVNALYEMTKFRLCVPP